MRVLLIDRHNSARNSLRIILSTLGVTAVHNAASANEALRQVKSYHFDIIFADYHLEDGRDSQQLLEELRQRVLRGQADFAALAREYSQDGSAKSGGDLGWAGPGRYVPEFEQALNALRPGEVSQPVVSRFGVHLIELLERREAKLTQREQRDMVRDQVREKKLDEAFTTWIQEARGRAYVEYRDAPQ